MTTRSLLILSLLLILSQGVISVIQSPDGDMIDCIRLKDQPSLNHPLFHNHVIQETPRNFPNMAKNEDAVNWQVWHSTGMSCPEGTIPVRRVVSPNTGAAERVTHGHEYAVGFMENPPKIYGTKVTMNVWHPKIENATEFSLGQLWLVSGSYENNDLNTIEAGWQVCPHIYGDSQPRLFIFWTRDAYNTAWCYNLRCAGFVQTSRTIVIEGAISPTSTFGGMQTDLTIQIWKDPEHGSWWLGVGFNNGTVLSPVGYWPTSIFTHLAESAEIVRWGGEIVNSNTYGRHTETQMGSGYFPDIGSGKSAYMRDLEISVTKGVFQPVYHLNVTATNPDYYKVKMSSNTSFYYGGFQHAGAVQINGGKYAGDLQRCTIIVVRQDSMQRGKCRQVVDY